MPMIREFLGNRAMKIAFIPFAYVDGDTSPLLHLVELAFAGTPFDITPVTAENGKQLLEDADAIMVSGGNTFKLLHDLYAADLVPIIKGKVKSGTPYIGWSAGANITGKTICTTNDMPIIEPKSFKALHFFPFQINPHYYNLVIEGHNGETRDQRLTEYVMLNPSVPVIGIPEGTALLYNKATLKLAGSTAGVLFRNEAGAPVKTELPAGSDLGFLLTEPANLV